ncbi:MAG TPA: gluconate 2-dehydrogenase subunit 3 family protein [Blastocatellia bacterium]|nr:gluconate 2-dehydrogenase subunit 3 family protein [Blastocatellia bacterium]
MSQEEKNPTRRDALKTLAGSVGSIISFPILPRTASSEQPEVSGGHHAHPQPSPSAKPVELRFFTRREKETLDILTDLIIPADHHSPGARAANVSEFIDRVVSVSPEVTQRLWREGLVELDRLTQERVGKVFVQASPEEQTAILREISQNEQNPQTLLERFFRELKNRTIDGYYTSEIGIHQELRYRGNRWMKDFPGCTHPEHLA